MSELITIADHGEGAFVEKKSKFIGYAAHVTSEEDATAFIEKIRSKHWDARHNVHAYVIGKNGELQRSSDDGEPSGTAGRPILEVIKGQDLTDVAVVVTRYFGGVLLGTGGLVRAYGKAASLALENSEKVRPVLMKTAAVCADYDAVGKIQNFLIQKEIVIDRIEYQNNAVIYCLIPEADIEDFSPLLNRQFQAEIPCTILKEETVHYLPL